MGEWNNILITKKFSSAYFTLLNEASVSSTTTVNCVPQDTTDLLHLRLSDEEREMLA